MNQKSKTKDISLSFVAQIDLLGFSNHLLVAGCDLRTRTGKQAVDRLLNIENAIKIFEKEKEKFPHLYPKNLQCRRFNDALFIGFDVDHLIPPIGQTALSGGYSIDELRKIHQTKGKLTSEGTVIESGTEVTKFLGLVSRLHNYINLKDMTMNFPGCRTVVASGLRKHFNNRNNEDDFFSANVSLTNAFEAQEMGSASGITGNNIYVEDNVAIAITYCEMGWIILTFAQFKPLFSSSVNPYQRLEYSKRISLKKNSWIVQDPIIVEIMKKQCVFRSLQSNVLTNLQIFEDYQSIAKNTDENLVEKQIYDSLTEPTPSLVDINKEGIRKYPFLALGFNLEEDYASFFDEP